MEKRIHLRLNAISCLTRNVFDGWIIFGVVLLLSIAACSDDSNLQSSQGTQAKTNPTQADEGPQIQVVTTSIIVTDWVENVGGEHVDVFSLLPVGGDPHTFQPGARDVARIADADIVLSIGLGLEGGWLNDLLKNAAANPDSIVETGEIVEPIVETGEIVEPIEFAEGHAEEVELLEGISHVVDEVEEGEISPKEGLEEIKELLAEGGEEEEGDDHEGEEELPSMVLEIITKVDGGQMKGEDAIKAIEGLTSEGEDEHEGHGHGLEDPHYWFDPLRVKLVVNDIAARLSVLNPGRGDIFRANADAYNSKLDELHAWTEQQVSTVPEEDKLLVTSHDSYGYFANLYGFEIVGVVLSGTTDVEPSAGDLADLVGEVKESGVQVVFGETTVSERLAIAVARESGAELVRLYSGSLGPKGSGAATYIEMMRTNVGRIVEGLK